MQDPTTRVRLIPGHAGRGGSKKKIITLHIQVGMNDLYSEFLNRPAGNQADCTVWVKRDGTIDRFLYDADTPWTNGDIVAPDMSNPIIASMVVAGVENTNPYAYTIEHQGFDYQEFPDVQIEATAKMCAYWMNKEGWTDVDNRITGHYQVGNHKNCPGPNFPWAKLRERVTELLDVPDRITTTGPIPPRLFVANPKGFDVGPGMLAKAIELKLTFVTNEQYFNPSVGQPGLGKMSRAWVQDSSGKTFVLMASEQPELAAAGQATPWKVELLEVK